MSGQNDKSHSYTILQGVDFMNVIVQHLVRNHLYLSLFAQKYLRKCKDTFFISQKKYLHIYEDSFGAKILIDDCDHKVQIKNQKTEKLRFLLP